MYKEQLIYYLVMANFVNYVIYCQTRNRKIEDKYYLISNILFPFFYFYDRYELYYKEKPKESIFVYEEDN